MFSSLRRADDDDEIRPPILWPAPARSIPRRSTRDESDSESEEGEEDDFGDLLLPRRKVRQWIATVESFSSQFSDSWAATCIVGRPKNYPRYA